MALADVDEFYSQTYIPLIRYLPESILEAVVTSDVTLQNIVTKSAFYLQSPIPSFTGTDTEVDVTNLANQGTRFLIKKLLETYDTSVASWRLRGISYTPSLTLVADLATVGNAETSMDDMLGKRDAYITHWSSLVEAIKTFLQSRVTSARNAYKFGNDSGSITVAETSTTGLTLPLPPIVNTLSVGSTCIGSHKGATTAGFIYSATDPTPTFDIPESDYVFIETTPSLSPQSSQFSAELNNLVQGTTYNIRAVAQNDDHNITYGNVMQYTHGLVPTVTTSAIDRQPQKVIGGGTIIGTNGAPIIASGVIWSTSQNPTIALATRTIGFQQSGAFTNELTGLISATSYYMRAYATNKFGTAYGDEVAFDSPTPPVITTAVAVTATATTTGLTLNGNLDSTGTSAITDMGFYWSLTDMGSNEPPIGNNVSVTPLTSTGAFSALITGLPVSFTSVPVIFVRTYAISDDGTTYSAQSQVAYKQAALPIVSLTTSNPTTRGADLLGTVTTPNGAISERGFFYSINAILTPADGTALSASESLLNIPIAAGAFSSTLNTLNIIDTSTMVWNVVAYARNENGYGYSPVKQFTQIQYQAWMDWNVLGDFIYIITELTPTTATIIVGYFGNVGSDGLSSLGIDISPSSGRSFRAAIMSTNINVPSGVIPTTKTLKGIGTVNLTQLSRNTTYSINLTTWIGSTKTAGGIKFTTPAS